VIGNRHPEKFDPELKPRMHVFPTEFEKIVDDSGQTMAWVEGQSSHVGDLEELSFVNFPLSVLRRKLTIVNLQVFQ
jgi:hypothetical protein